MKGGQLKEISKLPKTIIRTSGDVAVDLSKGLSKTLGGLTNGLEIITDAVGSTLDKISKNLEVGIIEVIPKAGDKGLEMSKKLGKVIQIIPILGNPVAFVVSGATKGVYYIVVSLGNVTGKSIRSTGKVVKTGSDLVVFTIHSTSTTTQSLMKEASDVVHKVAYDITKKL